MMNSHARDHILEALRQNPEISVLIIGAGINGIATFRDLALQGMDVLLVDQADFCSGASAASSHMIHGGIRYLENGEFRLVREAVRERNNLLQNAPHYVKPLATTIPIFKWFSGLFNAPLKFLGLLNKPTERGAVVIKIGLLLYDAYTRLQGTVPVHTWAFRKQSLEKYPQLNPAIKCTATYYDAMIPTPERLCIELILEAEAASPGARALNYMRVIATDKTSVRLKDEFGDEALLVKPKIVINAAGPWIDFANGALGLITRMVGGTKGSHLVLDHPQLHSALGGQEFFFENKDGRIVLLFPLMDKVLVGTSDLRIDDPSEARCTQEEVDYFLSMIEKVFPQIKVADADIVFTFSGVRPLPSSASSQTGQISRDHKIEVIEPGEQLDFPILCLIGGKWTSFRAFSEEVSNVVLERLGLKRLVSTEHLAIGGGRGYPRDDNAREALLTHWVEETALPRQRLITLFERYGTRFKEVASFIGAGRDEALREHAAYSRREISYLVREEKILHLDDLVLRRSLLAMLGELTPELLEELAQIVGESLGWSEEETHAEVKRTAAILQDKHNVSLGINRNNP